MDPALRELLRRGADEDEVEAVIRLATDVVAPPPGVRIVSRFGAIATCRLRRGEIPRVWEHHAVASLKAPRLIAPEAGLLDLEDVVEPRPGDARRPPGLAARGRGVVIGVLDWGLDFVRDSLRTAAGRTRIVALWDQRSRRAHRQDNFYGYGTIHPRDVIDAALGSRDPYAALGYHPADADPFMTGAHGTVVVDIAAGNGRSDGPAGVAPEADIVFVHLSSRGTGGLANLGDSIGILEGLDFVRRVAAGRPTAVSLSVGRHGGPHDGSTLVEAAIDAFLTSAPGNAMAQSAGNYRLKQTHVTGILSPGTTREFGLVVDALDPSSNELEVWHETAPCSVRLDAPNGTTSGWVPVGASTDLVHGGRLIARVYHRASDPQNRSHHIDAFIYPGAPAGEWTVSLRDERAQGPSQRFHAWIERDDACPHCQSRFRIEDADPSGTLGTLATGRSPLVCGAFDSHDLERPAAAFSSVGPTRDGRPKPDLVAPGVGILALRSQPRGDGAFEPFVRKSGTSMAAPQVAGTAALLLEVTAGRLWNEDIREIVLSTADPSAISDPEGRLGAGYLNINRAIEVASRHGDLRRGRGVELRPHRSPHKESPMPTHTELQALLDREIGADRLFRSVARGEPVEGLQVLATPGEALATPTRSGDLMVRVALGEPGLGHVAVLVDGRLAGPDALAAAGFTLESREPGFYGHVIDGGAFPHTPLARFARRILEASGQVPPGQLLVRPTPRLVAPAVTVRTPLPVPVSPVETLVTTERPAIEDVEDEEFEDFDRFADDDPVGGTRPTPLPTTPTPAPKTPATIGFEFDLNIGLSRDVFTARAADMPSGATFPGPDDRITNHREHDPACKLVDGFHVKVDGPRLEIATIPMDIGDDATFSAVVKNVVAFARELEKERGKVTADARISVTDVAGHPVRFNHPRTVISKFPLVIIFRGKKTALKWPSDNGVWSAPQATITILLEHVGELIDAIAKSVGTGLGTALSGAPPLRLGVRSDIVVRANRRVLADRTTKIGMVLSDKSTVTDADYSPALAGLLMLMTSYMLSGEILDTDDYEFFAKAYLPINVKAPFRDLFRDALSPRERFLFKELYADKRENFFALAKDRATTHDEDNELFPPKVRGPDLDRFHLTRPTWGKLLDNTVNDIPLKVTLANSVAKKKHALGDEILWAPISTIIPFAVTRPRVALELRRIGFAEHTVGVWEPLMNTVRALAKKLNP